MDVRSSHFGAYRTGGNEYKRGVVLFNDIPTRLVIQWHIHVCKVYKVPFTLLFHVWAELGRYFPTSLILSPQKFSE